MKTLKTLRNALAIALSATLLFGASSASAEFGITEFTGGLFNADGTSFTQASGHPYEATTSIKLTALDFLLADESVKDVEVEVPPGFVGNPTITPARCTNEQLFGPGPDGNHCPVSAQVGIAVPFLALGPGESGPFTGLTVANGLYNMVPPRGAPALFAFTIGGAAPIFLIPHLRNDGDYGLTVRVPEITQSVPVTGSKVTFWGNPADPLHDEDRGTVGQALGPDESSGGSSCAGSFSPANTPACSNPAGYPPTAFLTNPSNCSAGAQPATLRVNSWQHPDVFKTASFEKDSNGNSTAVTGCEVVPFEPKIAVQQSTDQTDTPTGLDFRLTMPSEGLLNPDGIGEGHIKRTKVTLPQGITLNPSAAEGLGTCSPAQLKAETMHSEPGGGCPNQSKVGSVEAHSALLEETIHGSVYIAKPFDNPFNSLLALYVVLTEPDRGILVKLAGELRTNEKTGRIEAEFDDAPQLPLSSFHFSFREGGRAPLVSPPTCGTYTTQAEFVPWSAADPDNPKPGEIKHVESSFQVTKGVGGGPCPSAGVPPFRPGFSAGAINNNAGSHTAFNMRLTRSDGEQNMTRFSAVLPPGVLGKLAGVDKCPDAAIAAAKAKSGKEEQGAPSCPANSQIGSSVVGAGVGSVLTYVPGKVYLGGPYKGDPLSVIAITPAVAGPFDVGTVVVQEALDLNPKTAEVEVDGSASDPIPHILKGIPAKLRDLRVYVNRPDFIINPTSCDPSQVKATLFGSYLDVFDPADDTPVDLATRFQAASCQSLGFKPRLALKLKGGTRRGGHPGLAASYRPRSGDANLEDLTVRLPRSAFLDQAHIRTICTRVQFAADACPPAARYGYIKAWTPLLEEPLQGPVWLRSSNHKLPDLVFDLHGLVDVEVATRIDSARGGIRATVESAPDAPLSKVELRMQGGKKGLIVNSRNLCGAISRANVESAGHNGKEATANPVMRAECGKARKGKTKRR